MPQQQDVNEDSNLVLRRSTFDGNETSLQVAVKIYVNYVGETLTTMVDTNANQNIG